MRDELFGFILGCVVCTANRIFYEFSSSVPHLFAVALLEMTLVLIILTVRSVRKVPR
jgi:hypothetical protein